MITLQYSSVGIYAVLEDRWIGNSVSQEHNEE